MDEIKVVIVGGGFGGITAALELAKSRPTNLKIRLISNSEHFEYHASLYRVVTGRSPLVVCLPLGKIFEGKVVEVIKDEISQVDLNKKILRGSSESNYSYDFLILALGSETAYYPIPGLADLAFPFKSISQALRLKNHLHQVISLGKKQRDPKHKSALVEVVLIGAGPTGVELASELAIYLKKVAQKHHLDPNLIKIDLIEGKERILPLMPEEFSRRIQQRLESLGVRVLVKQKLTKMNSKTVYLDRKNLRTRTLIWTAGVKTNRLFQAIAGLPLSANSRVLVDDYLQASGLDKVFIIGDAAATLYSGLATNACRQGRYVAKTIKRKLLKQKVNSFQEKVPIYSVPVGSGWAGVIINKTPVYGFFGWWIRRWQDLRFFLSILGPVSAFQVFSLHQSLSESCPECNQMESVEIT